MKTNEISTNNKGVLEIIEPFILLSGIENADKCMGKAKNKKGEVFEIYPYHCNIETCYCWSTAIKI